MFRLHSSVFDLFIRHHRRGLRSLLAQEFGPQTFILVFAHDEALLDPLDSVAVQLLLGAFLVRGHRAGHVVIWHALLGYVFLVDSHCMPV